MTSTQRRDAVINASDRTVTRPADRVRFARACTAIVVGLMVVESALGLAVHNIYDEATWGIAALRGNDLVTLGLVAPALTIALVRSRTSQRWTLVWFAGLLYSVYNYAYYAFGTNFNDIFLLHVATMALSIAALIHFVLHFDTGAVEVRTKRGRSDRIVAAYMVFVGAALILAWGGLSLRFAVNGTLPKDVMPPTAVHLVYALDMSLLAPAFLAGGVLLWRRAAWGHALGVAVNLFGAAYLTVLEFVGGFEANAGIDGKTWASLPSIGGAVLCVIAAAVILRRMAD